MAEARESEFTKALRAALADLRCPKCGESAPSLIDHDGHVFVCKVCAHAWTLRETAR